MGQSSAITKTGTSLPGALETVCVAISRARRGQPPWSAEEREAVGDLILDAFFEGFPQWVDDRRGKLYVAVNAAWPGLYKIGCTRRSLDARMASLNKTGLATPWVVVAAWRVDDAHGLEAQAHAACAQYRFKNEMFAAELSDLVSCIESVLDTDQRRLEKQLVPLLTLADDEHLLDVERIEIVAPVLH